MPEFTSIRTVNIERYITPLREGGSLPAIVEADDGFKYVLKFRGAGQGVKALVAELIGGCIAKKCGLKIPEIVFAEVDPAFGRTEPDKEIQDLLKASAGLNLGLHYLQGSITFDPQVTVPNALEASKIVWLDALLMNVDRTVRNTNMLMWKKELWLIDHGASLYFHHGSSDWKENCKKPFPLIKDHVLIKYATELKTVDAEFKTLLTDHFIDSVINLLPEQWLENNSRNMYSEFLKCRIKNSEIFLTEAENAAKTSI